MGGGLWIDVLHQSQSMSTQNAGAGGRGGRRREEAENNNSTDAVQVVAKEIKQTQKAK